MGKNSEVGKIPEWSLTARVLTDEIDTTKNPSICQQAFVHTYMGTTYDRRLCCIYQGGELGTKVSLEEHWNSPRMKNVRLDMLAGKKIKGCEVCYKAEEAGILSSRRTNRLQHAPNIITEETRATGYMTTLPSDFDYRTIHCNLTCLHCAPTYSSSWQALMGDMDNPIYFKSTIDSAYEEQSKNEMIRAIDERRLETIYWAGGEPMMSTIHWDVMEHLKKLNETDPDYVQSIVIRYNTNLTRSKWKGRNVYEYLAFIDPELSPSLDGIEETFNYIRSGGDWNVVKENWEQANQYFSDVTLATVITPLWVFDVDRYLDFFEQWNPRWLPQKLIRADCHGPSYKGAPGGFLDSNLYPAHILFPAIDHALERVSRSTLPGAERAIAVLNDMKNEHETHHEKTLAHAEKTKHRTLQLEKHLNQSLSSLLQKTNPEAWLWYNTLQAIPG